MRTAKDVITELFDTSKPIYDKWCVMAETPLRNSLEGKSVLDVLEQDVIAVGDYIASSDTLAQSVEHGLIAECVAHLRVMQSVLPSAAMLEQEITRAREEILPMLSEGNAADGAEEKEAPIPLIWHIALQVHEQEPSDIPPEVFEKLRAVIIYLIDLFVLFDGNVTNEELAYIKTIEKQLVIPS